MPSPSFRGQPAPAPLRARRWATLLAGAALAAALAAVAGPQRVAGAVAGADARWLLLAGAAYLAIFAVRGVRWALLLGRPRLASSTALLTGTGWLVSTFVPLKAGDVVRAAWLSRRSRVPFGTAAGTVAVERALDLLGLALAASVALLALAARGIEAPAALRTAMAVAWLAPPAAVAFLTALAATIPPERRRSRLLRFAGTLADEVPRLLRRPRLAAACLALTVLGASCQAAVYTFLVQAFLPDAPFALAALGAPLFLLTFIVAVTPGHLGTYEAGFALVFSSLGLGTASDLLAVAFGVHLAAMGLVAVLGGLCTLALGAVAPRGIPGSPTPPSPALPAPPTPPSAKSTSSPGPSPGPEAAP